MKFILRTIIRFLARLCEDKPATAATPAIATRTLPSLADAPASESASQASATPFAGQREIFRYEISGRGVAFADPLVVLRELKRDENFNIDIHGPLMASTDPEIADEVEKAVVLAIAATRRIFELPPLNKAGEGVTDEECLRLMTEFFDWVADQKKTSVSSRIQPLPTEPASSES